MRRAASCRGAGHRPIDCGTSGGVWGIERGYCLMIGGAETPSRGSIRSSSPSPRRDARPHARAEGEPDSDETATFTAGRAARPLREDGAQRHRVRPDGRLRRRTQHPPQRERRRGRARRWTPRPRRWSTPSTTSSTSTLPRWPRSGGGAASSAPGSRPDRGRPQKSPDLSDFEGASPTPARAAGLRSPRSRGRPRRGAHHRPLLALRLPQPRRLRRPRAVRDAQQLRRARREEGVDLSTGFEVLDGPEAVHRRGAELIAEAAQGGDLATAAIAPSP